tara:strand:- start:156 stop:881 length:726 start_codon:yes stop_codon:yes gene_type:complete
MRELLLDADILLYQLALKCEIEVDWGNDLWTLASDLNEAKQRLDIAMNELMHNLDADLITGALTEPNNFRKNLYPEYKANRKDKRKPLGMKALREYYIANYTTKVFPTLEADDVLGILATEPSKNERIIVSIDKDLGQIPSKLSVDQLTITKTTKRIGDRLHLYQTLIGDTADNYKGCPGVGPVKANKILGKSCSWKAVVEAYAKESLTEADALVQARLAKILQHEDYNQKTGEIKLWKSK